MAGRKPKTKWGGGSFVALPRAVLKSHGFANLSHRAVKLLIDIMSQYHGHNNGNLCATDEVMEKRGWKSKSQLTSARKELTDKGFIAVSRMGGRNRATLFSITFFSIDECINTKTKLSRHEVRSTDKPANSWKKLEPKKAVMDLKSAQKKHKVTIAEKNIQILEQHIKDNPDDKYLKQTMAGIEYWKSQLN